MRTLVRAFSRKEAESRVRQMKREGWKALTDIKVDESYYMSVNYVCVMEKEDIKVDPSKKKRTWGKFC